MLQILLTMLVLLPYAISNPSNSYAQGPKFYVKRVEVLSEHDPTYVHRFSHAILPPDKLVDERDIACLTDEIRSTDLYSQVNTRLVRKAPDVRILVLTLIDKPGVDAYVIGGIELGGGLSEVNEARFQAELKSRDVLTRTRLFAHSMVSIEESIGAALRKSLPVDVARQAEGLPWLKIRPTGGAGVKIIVSDAYEGCGKH
jgi:hypothetical protein